MSTLIAAIIFGSIEVLLAWAYITSGQRIAQKRQAAGSTERITMASSFWLVLWFFYHVPLLVTLVPLPWLGQRFKAIAVNVGTPLLYFLIFVLTGRHGMRWHRF